MPHQSYRFSVGTATFASPYLQQRKIAVEEQEVSASCQCQLKGKGTPWISSP
jgi:hypothetical protein